MKQKYIISKSHINYLDIKKNSIYFNFNKLQLNNNDWQQFQQQWNNNKYYIIIWSLKN